MDGEELSGLPAWERARAGLFLALQHPVEVPGVGLHSLLAAAAAGGSVRRAWARSRRPSLQERMEEEAKAVGLDPSLLRRPLNVDLSGGERKRTEMVQLGVIRPAVCILDEVDSGLDVDALGEVARRLQHATTEWGVGLLAITHFNRFLVQLEADLVHVLVDGRIVATGDAALALRARADGIRRLPGQTLSTAPARGTPVHACRQFATVLGTVLLHGERSSPGRRVGSLLPETRRASTRTRRGWPRSGARCARRRRRRARGQRVGPARARRPHRLDGRRSTTPAQRQAEVERAARRWSWRSLLAARARRGSSSAAATPTSGTATTRSTRCTSATRWRRPAARPSPSSSSARTAGSGSRARPQAFGSSSVVTGQRSDVVQLWRVTPSTKQIQIISIPRDTVVSMLPPDTAQYGTYNRINSAYNSGANQLVKTITANFGIPINHVVQVDFSGFQDAVNALGGIYLDFPYPAKDSYSGLNITTPGLPAAERLRRPWPWPGPATTSTTPTATGTPTGRATSAASSARTSSSGP